MKPILALFSLVSIHIIVDGMRFDLHFYQKKHRASRAKHIVEQNLFVCIYNHSVDPPSLITLQYVQLLLLLLLLAVGSDDGTDKSDCVKEWLVLRRSVGK